MQDQASVRPSGPAATTTLKALSTLFGVLFALLLVSGQSVAQSSDNNSVQGAAHNVRVYPVRLKHEVPKESGQAANNANSNSPIFPANGHLVYYGGPVVSNIQVVVVYYGTGSYLSNLQTNLPAFFTAITNGTYMDMLSEYGTVGQSGTTTSQLIHHGTYAGTYTITPSAANNGSTIDDSQIQSELIAQITAGALPAPTYDASGNANTMYMIYFPQGKTITQGGTSSCVSGGFCAYHGTISHLGQDVLYGIQPDMQSGSGCDVGCGNGATPFDNYTSVASHEFSETITDAAVGLATTLSPPLAWYDNTNGEIGDICNAIQGSADGYTVQGEWSNLQNGCAFGPVTFTVAAPANATAGTSFSLSVTAKNSAGSNVGAAYLGKIHFTSTDSTATLPADYTFTSADAGAHSFSVTLRASGNQAINVSDVVAIGFQGTTTVSVAGADFGISASPSSFSIQQGTSGTSTVSTTVLGGSGTVNLSVSGVPVGATASLSPTSIAAGSSSTLTVNAGTAATGTYNLTVTGTEGSATHSTTVAVTITSTPPPPDFTIGVSPSSVTLQQGGTGTSTVSTTVVGTSGTVNLNISGLPSGASASFSPASVTAGSSSTLTINAGTAAAGGYTLTVTGTEGSNVHSTTVTLTITVPPPPPDFTISASPSSLNLVQGNSGTSTISTTVVGTAGTVSLSISGVPSGATASLSQASIAAGSSSTLTVGAGTAAAGTYTLTITGVESSATHSTSVTLTISAAGAIVNGGFEAGNLSGWTVSGTASVVSSGAHSGTYAARVGSTNPTSGDSSISQSFAAPSSGGTLSFYYKVVCPDTLTYDWATATLKDTVTGTTTVIVPKTCTNNGTWVQYSASLSANAGHIVTLTLVSHDDNYPGDATYTLYDDVTLTAVTPPGVGITNGGFEAGNFNGWTFTGAAHSLASPGHSGSYAAMLGSTSPTNGDSTLTQSFVAPSGTNNLTVWYNVTCPDTVTYDWALVTLADNTAGTTATLLPKTCVASSGWKSVATALTAGHTYTLKLVSHDDNYTGDPTYTLYDDVTVSAATPPPTGITNGGFETGNLSGWTASGAATGVASPGHSGTYAARLGSTVATNGDSSITQTFVVPSGATILGFWYYVSCPDTVTYDWATVTLKDNTTGTTTTVLPKTCPTTASWTQKTVSVTAGHTYVLTLTSHDDNYSSDPTFTLYDDVTLQ